MGLNIETLRKAAEGAMYVSDQRLCVSAEGELVAEDDARAVRLLVGAGGSIPAREAAAYGLIADASAAAVLGEAAAAVGGEAAPAEAPAAAEVADAAAEMFGEEKPASKGKKSSG